ncbi:hypothetical protein Enr13x_37870 [Stieleria neptunia]|uniref:Uncharacterized protein n=1 Tax=Stieleria neptunia TaxID=2527979 RepID=A0A518HSW1_9BACT|nr:hypothetical protein [Stieleria neptunia]QDV43927.1 hypothetical protein Enr13x_37870 [Stieleria neptunia]
MSEVPVSSWPKELQPIAAAHTGEFGRVMTGMPAPRPGSRWIAYEHGIVFAKHEYGGSDHWPNIEHIPYSAITAIRNGLTRKKDLEIFYGDKSASLVNKKEYTEPMLKIRQFITSALCTLRAHTLLNNSGVGRITQETLNRKAVHTDAGDVSYIEYDSEGIRFPKGPDFPWSDVGRTRLGQTDPSYIQKKLQLDSSSLAFPLLGYVSRKARKWYRQPGGLFLRSKVKLPLKNRILIDKKERVYEYAVLDDDLNVAFHAYNIQELCEGLTIDPVLIAHPWLKKHGVCPSLKNSPDEN